VFAQPAIALPLGLVEELIGRTLVRKIWVLKTIVLEIRWFVPGQRRLQIQEKDFVQNLDNSL
jgi:hypothetical protein